MDCGIETKTIWRYIISKIWFRLFSLSIWVTLNLFIFHQLSHSSDGIKAFIIRWVLVFKIDPQLRNLSNFLIKLIIEVILVKIIRGCKVYLMCFTIVWFFEKLWLVDSFSLLWIKSRFSLFKMISLHFVVIIKIVLLCKWLILVRLIDKGFWILLKCLFGCE